MKRFLATILSVILTLSLFIPVSAEKVLAETIYYCDSACYTDEGDWASSSGLKGPNGSGSRYGYGEGYAMWRPDIIGEGKYRVSIYNIVHHTNAEVVNGEVKDKNGIHPFSYVHKDCEEGFVELGVFEFAAGTDGYVKVFNQELVNDVGFVRPNSVKYEQLTGSVFGKADVPTDDVFTPVTYVTRPIPAIEASIPQIKENAVKIYVQDGANGDGTKENPFGTIKEAKKKVRAIINEGYPEGGIGVYLREGIYALDDSLSFTAEDSGTKESPVIWQAYEDEKVTLTGAKVIDASSFKPVEDAEILKRLPVSGQGKVYYYDLSDMGVDKIEKMAFDKPYLLTIGDKAGRIARWPNDGYGLTGTIFDTCSRQDNGIRKKGFTYNIIDPNATRWESADNVLMYGYWLTPYDLVGTQMAEFNTDAMTFSSKMYSVYGAYGSARYYAFNLLEEIDAPGEWYVDAPTKKVYLYPTEGWENEKISLAYSEFDLITFEDASNVMVKGFRLSGAGGNGATISKDATNCGIIGCEILNVSGDGAEILGKESFIRDSDIYLTGNAGIRIQGGNKYELEACNNYAENNLIHDVGQSGSDRTGISFGGCGVRLSHNHIYNTAHRGMSGSGLEHLIEYNIIERTNMDMNDTGAIYYGDLGMGYGTVIRYNLIRDSVGLPQGAGNGEGSMGIYIDQLTGGVDVYGNLVYNLKENAFLNNGGHNNKWHNNIAVAADRPYINHPWYNERTVNMVRSNMNSFNLTSEAFMSKYPMLYELKDDENLQYSMNVQFWNNVKFASGENEFEGIEDKGGRLENNISFDELPNCDLGTFFDLDYTEIKKQIPDFEELPIKEMGIYTGGARKTTETVVFDNKAKDFNLKYPANKATGVDPATTLKWEIGDGGIKHYTIYVALDPEFEILINKLTTNNAEVNVNLDYGTTYYWRVEATPMLGYDNRWNSNGVCSFTTMSLDDKMEYELLSAKTLLDLTEEGNGANQFPEGSKIELKKLVDLAENGEETKENYDGLKEGIKKYLSLKNIDKENLAIAIYDDFTLDRIGEWPLNLYLRSGFVQDGKVQKDPLDDKNNVVSFDDKEKTFQHGERYFAVQDGYVEASMDVYADQTTSTAAVTVHQEDSWLYTHGMWVRSAAKVSFEPDGFIYAGQKKFAKIMDYEAKRWYNIKMVLDVKSKSYDVYIDGSLMAEKVPFDNQNIERVGVLSFDTAGCDEKNQELSGKFYIDNMFVKTSQSFGRNQYLKSVTINGEPLKEFTPAEISYKLNLSKDELKNADFEFEVGTNATTKVWDLDGKKAVTVLNADKNALQTYIFISK